METACGYLDDKVMWVSTDEIKWKNRIEQWAQEYPEECVITVRPENNDGCMCAKMPASWFRMRPPIKRNLTDEQREAMGERLLKARENREDDMEDDE